MFADVVADAGAGEAAEGLGVRSKPARMQRAAKARSLTRQSKNRARKKRRLLSRLRWRRERLEAW